MLGIKTLEHGTVFDRSVPSQMLEGVKMLVPLTFSHFCTFCVTWPKFNFVSISVCLRKTTPTDKLIRDEFVENTSITDRTQNKIQDGILKIRLDTTHLFFIMEGKKDLTKDQIKVTLSLHKAVRPVREIARIVGVTRRCVQKWIRKFRMEGGVATPEQKKRPGRGRKTSSCTINVVKRQVDAFPQITARELKEQNPQLLGQVSVRTVQHCLHDDLEFRRHRALKKPLTTLGNKSLGLHLPLNISSGIWQNGMMVWACFRYHGVGNLVFLPRNENMNQNNYLELLCDFLPGSFEMCNATVFMQDGAPCHRAKSILTWLQNCQIDFLEDWPPKFPDLNPIENIWSIMKRRLQRRDISDITKLRTAIKEEWHNLNQITLKNLAESLPSWLLKCIRRKAHQLLVSS
ncbi:uncharacterized protein LOC123518022 [Portunus trituberculatus]|uniref:uncharacterized protein LOC123518022 n=1 Tax=Portunus trituberculatus TaxID=210409 RepID=UPI001E1CD9D9|nr:uncharacterized protein LOC123518022 [Portunus trituberculatus]